MKTTIKKHKLKALFSAIALSGMLITPSANALLPTTDAANLAQSIMNNLQRAMEWAKDAAMQASQMDLMGELSGLQVDNINNGFANMIARLNRTQAELQNMEQLEKSIPAQDACQTVTVSNLLEDALCNADSQVETLAAQRQETSDLSRGKAGGGEAKPATVAKIAEVQATKTRELIASCEALKDSSGNSMCAKPSLLITAPGGALSDKEYKAAQYQNEVAANAIAPKVPLATGFNVETDSYKQSALADMRRENIRDLALASLDNVLIITQGTLENNTRKPGELFAMQKFADDRFGSASWLCQVTNSCADTTSSSAYVSPAELEKRAAEMDAFMLHLAVAQYKQSLREEQLMANLVLMQVDAPLDNVTKR
ncbi:hypothetical protein IFT48_04600 [Pseudomonas fluorescens]|uniref:hypothetical protein n=1 Tax=Pseudomonas TaxID=286 RepID=UPI000F031DB7|nr:hypothetical protein [Pseudomonas viridiflava]MBD8089253.1 hypothetical protein [Pseudomonas fluorescens]MBD8615320.1 hypothetical protein [Pseudomonas putida]MBD8682026.1 hypothetical protein [Pseudomonas sp. CFBP 13719]